jgi:hypothetical protein
MAPAARGVGAGGTHDDKPVDTRLPHRVHDIAGANGIRVDGLSGERHTERRQHGAGTHDDPGEAVAADVRAGDRQSRIGDRELVGPPGHGHNRVTGVERAVREQPPGRSIGAKDRDLHENSFDD